MKKYKKRISKLVKSFVAENFDESKWKTVEKKFQKWKDATKKEDVKHYFDDYLFGLCYAQDLYNSRVDCFHEVLKRFSKIPQVLQIIKQSKNIVSFGCGPGPEIAAYISFVRKDLKCPDLFLDIAAVDQLSYWGKFIEAVSDIDGLAKLTFVNQTVDMKFMTHKARTDVCIMSYPHAVDFDDIWELLKIKFKLIIVIDQAKPKLLENVRKCGYQVVNFVYKRNKTFFFYFDPNACYQNRRQFLENFNYDSYENYKRPSFLPSPFPGIGSQMFQQSSSNALIECQLSCGHTIIVKRYEYDVSIRCGKIVMKKCPRNLHVKWTVCGQPFICEELCEKVLGFNHRVFIKCSQMETGHVPFGMFAHHQLERENVINKHPFQYRNLMYTDLACDKNLMEKFKRKQIERERLNKMRMLRN